MNLVDRHCQRIFQLPFYGSLGVFKNEKHIARKVCLSFGKIYSLLDVNGSAI